MERFDIGVACDLAELAYTLLSKLRSKGSMLYACETRVMTKHSKARHRYFATKCYRKITRIGRSQKATNKILTQQYRQLLEICCLK